MHMTDVHLDSYYAVGADWNCTNTYLCCRNEDGYPTDPARQAQPWGAYLCDLPE